MICLVGFSAIGLWIYLRHSLLGIGMPEAAAERTGYVLWGLAAVCAVLGFLVPQALRPLFVGLTLITLPIGFVVSHVIMALLFYGLFTPVALIFRVLRRDSLQRRFDPEAESYWTPRRPSGDRRRYFRQY